MCTVNDAFTYSNARVHATPVPVPSTLFPVHFPPVPAHRVSHGLFSSDDESEEETPVRVRQPLRLLWNRVNTGAGAVKAAVDTRGDGQAGRLHAARSPVKRFALSPLGGAGSGAGAGIGGVGGASGVRGAPQRGAGLPCPMLHAPSPSQVSVRPP